MEMDKKKSESAVKIKKKKKASKQTKEEASMERAMSMTSSNSTKTSEQKEQKGDTLSFDYIKVYVVKMEVVCTLRRYDGIDKYCFLMLYLLQDKRKKKRLRPMERRMREEEWEIEQEKFFYLKQGAENRPPVKERETIRYDTD